MWQKTLLEKVWQKTLFLKVWQKNTFKKSVIDVEKYIKNSILHIINAEKEERE